MVADDNGNANPLRDFLHKTLGAHTYWTDSQPAGLMPDETHTDELLVKNRTSENAQSPKFEEIRDVINY